MHINLPSDFKYEIMWADHVITILILLVGYHYFQEPTWTLFENP